MFVRGQEKYSLFRGIFFARMSHLLLPLLGFEGRSSAVLLWTLKMEGTSLF